MVFPRSPVPPLEPGQRGSFGGRGRVGRMGGRGTELRCRGASLGGRVAGDPAQQTVPVERTAQPCPFVTHTGTTSRQDLACPESDL